MSASQRRGQQRSTDIEEHGEVIEEYIGKERLARRLLGPMGRGEYPGERGVDWLEHYLDDYVLVGPAGHGEV